MHLGLLPSFGVWNTSMGGNKSALELSFHLEDLEGRLSNIGDNIQYGLYM